MSTGAQWRADAQAEAARQAKAMRSRRGRRRQGVDVLSTIGPGMVRKTVLGDGDGHQSQPPDSRPPAAA